VARLRDQPFALLGINSDEDWDALVAANRQQDVCWRSWWDGGRDGSVARAWRVLGWPQVYVLDGQGIIRFTNLRGAELDRAVDLLLAERQ
jgi:hypothetical protein